MSGITWQALDNQIYMGGQFTTIDNPPEKDMIICGYCDANQNANNPSCQCCGGSLNDDISNRRNGLGKPIKFGVTAQEAADALAMVFGR